MKQEELATNLPPTLHDVKRESYLLPKASLVQVPYLNTPGKFLIYEDCLVFEADTHKRPGQEPPLRLHMDITGFSYKSRLRMFKWINMLHTSILHEPVFITLTYHKNFPSDPYVLKADLNKFLTYFKRTYPDSVYLWRMELQKRGAPHFHLLVYFRKQRNPNFFKLLLWHTRNAWLAINGCGCNDCKRYAVNIRKVDSKRKAVSYISKYIGKIEDEDLPPLAGRRWGTTRNAPLHVLKFGFVSKENAVNFRIAVESWMIAQGGKTALYSAHVALSENFFLFCSAETAMDLVTNCLVYDPGWMDELIEPTCT